MTSGERHEKRYHNRLKRRQELKNNFLTSLPTYDELFTFDNLFDAFYKCRTNVRWKESIQRYEANLYTNIYDLFKQLENRTFKSKGFHTFVINERGKQRWIRSVHISERIVQKVLCDNYLVPLLSHYLIYDNGATLKGKGTDFTLIRLNLHLHKYYREFNTNKGYILIYDFSDYFGSINHNILFDYISNFILDKDIFELVVYLVNNFGSVGLGLGSQVSQILSVAFPNRLDHYFKDFLSIKYYGRYMDDGYVICNNMDDIRNCEDKLYEISSKLDLKISPRKIKIERLDKGFKFLKKDIILTDSGKVVMSLCNKSITNERRRLIAYKKMFEYGKIGMDIILQSYKSWRGWAIKFDNNRSVHNMDMLFIELFGEYITPDDLSFKLKSTRTKPQPIRRRCCYDR